ncbi:MAG: endonuclease/exonuclease/phosphatase family protein [Actinomycetota bacterium]
MIATEERVGTERRRERPPWLGWVGPLALAALPWAWFLVRDLSPSMDAVAFGLPFGAALVALLVFGVAILSTRMRLALVSLSLVLLAVVVTIVPRLPQTTPAPLDPFRIVSANTYVGNHRPADAASAVAARRPSVAVAVETRRSVVDALTEALAGDDSVHAGRLNVFSTWPLEQLPPIPAVSSDTAIRVEVRRPGMPFVVYAIHLSNPLHETSFSQHARTVGRLLRAAETERLPVVLAGDFNMSDRTTSYRAMDAAMHDAMRSQTAASTYEDGLWALLQLRIDHVFVSPQLCDADGATFNVPGSDHQGLAVDIGRCP